METFDQVKKSVVGAAKEAKEFVADRVEDAKNLVTDMAGKVKSMGRADDNALAVLKRDHELVSSYFDKLEALPAQADMTATGEGLFAQLKYEFETHATVEERLFYPSLEKTDAARQLVAKALSQHQVVKQLLSELSMTPMNAAWRIKLTQLKQKVQEHVDMEENQIFPIARSLLSEQQLDALGVRIESEKETVSGSTGKAAVTQTSGQAETQAADKTAPARPGFPGKSPQRTSTSKPPQTDNRRI